MKKSDPIEPREETPQPFVITSEIDAYINDRLKSQPKDWNDVRAVSEDPKEEKWHVLSLAPEVDAAFKKRGVTPRWINKDKRMIDRALDVRGWELVNRTLFPELKKHLFTANGTIERGDAILGFMRNERADKLRSEPREKSTERVKNLPVERWRHDARGDKYYQPDLSQEKDGEVVEGIQP